MTCTCDIEEQHLRELADLLEEATYAVERGRRQLEVSGGYRVPDWEQECAWFVQCYQPDEQGGWYYRYDSGEPLGEVGDKHLVLFRLKARIHGIDLLEGNGKLSHWHVDALREAPLVTRAEIP